MRARVAIAETALGLAVVALGGLVAGDTALAPTSPLYAQVGPTAFPYGAAAGLALLGALLTVEGARGGWRDPVTEAELGRLRWHGFLWLGAGLLGNVALIGVIGFILASTLLFACVARAFGSQKLLRDAGIGFALAFIAYLGFAKLLSIRLGSGAVEALIDRLI